MSIRGEIRPDGRGNTSVRLWKEPGNYMMVEASNPDHNNSEAKLDEDQARQLCSAIATLHGWKMTIE